MDLIVTYPGGKRVDARLGDYVVRTDQPRKEGGDGQAPSPFEYFLVSLATCAGFYVLSYLQARGLPTEKVEIIQNLQTEPSTKRLKKISIKIVVPAEIDPKHHLPMIRAAEKCSVKKLIENPPTFEINAEVLG